MNEARKRELFSMLKRNDGQSLSDVCRCGNKNELAYLYKNKKYTNLDLIVLFIDSDACLENIFFKSIKDQDIPHLDKLLNKGFDINYFEGWALIESVNRGNLQMVDYLVTRGADIYARDGLPLIIAKSLTDKSIEHYLLGKGAINLKLNVKLSMVSKLLKDEFKPFRGGIIPYFFYNNKPIFMLGVDRRYGELTDFGGKICYNKDKNFLAGSLRELKEESLDILDFTKTEIYKFSPVLHTQNTAITFLLIDKYFDFRKDFRNIVDDKSELCDVFFVSMQDLFKLRQGIIINRGTYYDGKKCYRSYKLYDLVQNILNTNAFLLLEDYIGRMTNMTNAGSANNGN